MDLKNDDFRGNSMRRVLIADDDTGFLDSLTIALRREKHDVRAAETSEDVLNMLDKEEFDLLMMDLRLGPQDGVEVAEWAKLRYPKLPVVFMSAYPYTELSGRIRRISPFPVLEKPFDIGALNPILEKPH